MGIEYEKESSPGYGYQQQQNYTMAQQNYTSHHPNYTMAQHNYNVEEEHDYDDNGYYSTNDPHYSSHVRLNQAIPSSYHQHQQQQLQQQQQHQQQLQQQLQQQQQQLQQQQHQQQHYNHRVVQPVALYAPPPSVRGWGSSNPQHYFGNRGSKYRGSGYNVHQNSSGGYQSEWMYN